MFLRLTARVHDGGEDVIALNFDFVISFGVIATDISGDDISSYEELKEGGWSTMINTGDGCFIVKETRDEILTKLLVQKKGNQHD